MSRTGVATVGGIAGAALITSLASQGLQYLGGYLFARGIGDLNRNVLVGLCVNTVLTALGTAGLPYAREAFLAARLRPGRVPAAGRHPVGPALDLRAEGRHRRCTSGRSIPSTTPISRSCSARWRSGKLDKIIIHPTLIPRLHAEAFRKGEIRVGRLQGRLPGLREDRQGRRQRRLFPDRQHLPAARDAQGADRARGGGSGARRQGRGDLPARDLRHARLPGRDRRDQEAPSRRAAAYAARHRLRRHDGAPDLRRMRLDLSVAHPAPRQGFGDGDPQGRQGHDAGRRDRRAGPDFAESSGGDGGGPPLPERQRSIDRGVWQDCSGDRPDIQTVPS